MFENVIDNAREALTPVAQSAAATLESYAERIIARLDGIEEAVTDEEFTERQVTRSIQLVSNVPSTIDVPLGEEWHLTNLTWMTPAAVNPTLVIRQNGALLLSHFGSRSTALMPDIRVPTGAQLELTSPGNNLEVGLQWTVRRPNPGRRAHGRGERQLYNQFERLNEPERHMPGIDGSLIKAGSGGEGLGSNNDA